MIKVFLVEDEMVVRKGIRDKILWEKEGMEFVGEAADGEMAYPLIKKTKPDILITDIQMPFMDGLELSRIVRRELPRTKIIIVSGYGQFDYAKQAINIGVMDYILKPVTAAGLTETLKGVVEKIKDERREEEILLCYEKEKEERILLDRQKLYYHMISGTLSPTEIIENAASLGVECSFPASCVMRLTMLETAADDEKTGKAKQLAVAKMEEMKAFVNEIPDSLWITLGIDGVALVLGGDRAEQVQEHIKMCDDKLKELVEEEKNLHYFAGIGDTVFRLGDVSKSYQQASRAFANRFFLKLDQAVCQEQAEKLYNISSDTFNIDEIRKLRVERGQITSFLKSGSIDEVHDFMDEYFLNIGANNFNSLMFRQYLVMDMYMAAADFLEGMGLSTERLSGYYKQITEVAVGSVSSDDMIRYLKDLLKETLSLRDGVVMKRYSQMIEEAKGYIQENFCNDEISLNTTAAYVNISPSYFSSLFSQETGMTFVEYVTALRIEKAKELLMCTGLRTSEIGYQVGYKDSHYFSYIFKKTVNCTPKDFRKRGKEV